MIELVWTDRDRVVDYDIMMCASSLLAWLAATIAQNKENHDIDLNGYMIVKDQVNGCSILVIPGDPYSQKKLLYILQQPPEEYKDKYIARVPSEEPNPVHEKTEKETDECEIEITDKT